MNHMKRFWRSAGAGDHTKEVNTMADIKGYIVKKQANGSVNISDEVILSLAAAAAAEVEGVSAEETKSRKNISRNIKADYDGVSLKLDMNVSLKYGSQLQNVSAAVQENVAAKISSVTGIPVTVVNVNIIGIAFEKEGK